MDTNYDKLEQVDISSEMRTSFLDYSMSVIVQRALPDVRDGHEAGASTDPAFDEHAGHHGECRT